MKQEFNNVLDELVGAEITGWDVSDQSTILLPIKFENGETKVLEIYDELDHSKPEKEALVIFAAFYEEDVEIRPNDPTQSYSDYEKGMDKLIGQVIKGWALTQSGITFRLHSEEQGLHSEEIFSYWDNHGMPNMDIQTKAS